MVTEMFNWSECVSMIEQSETIAVLPHLSADGDALGSAFSLALALTAVGKEVAVLLEEPPEKRLEFLLPDFGPDIYMGPVKCWSTYDLAIAVDCADRQRLGNRAETFFSAGRSVKIDHHIEKDPFGQLNFVSSGWAANCEGIWELLCSEPFTLRKKLQEGVRGEDRLLTHMAVCLYCGIASDTGSFAYSNTTESTHQIAGMLVDFLKDVSDLHFRLFDGSTKAAIAMKAIAYQKIQYKMDGRVALLELTKEDFTASGAVYDDTNELVSVLRGIEGVELAVFARPHRSGRGLKISLRSNRECDVAVLAAKFGGGGHKRAAGFDFDGDFTQAVEELLNDVEAGV
jgi:phosphoesterase RecJ-like protein